MSNGTTFATATEPSMKNAELMLFVRSTARDTSAITIEAPAFFRSDSIEIAVALEEDGTASLIRVFSRGHCTPHANAARRKYRVVCCADEDARTMETHAVHTHASTVTRPETRPDTRRGASSVPNEDRTNRTESHIPISVSFTPLCSRKTPRN